MRRYHKLHIGYFESDSLLDENGNFIQRLPVFKYACACRADFNSAGKKIQSEDGETVVFSYAIIAGKDCPDIPIGTLVRVVKDGEVLSTAAVIYFARTSKNCVLWV